MQQQILYDHDFMDMLRCLVNYRIIIIIIIYYYGRHFSSVHIE